MSTTFHTSPMPPVETIFVRCWGNSADVRVEPADVNAAASIADAHSAECDDCRAYGGPLLETLYEVPDVNMNGGNTHRMLTLLGFSDESDMVCGSMRGDEFLGRVLKAQSRQLATVPAVSDGPVDLRDGAAYVAMRLGELRDIASWASAHQATVVWG